MPSAARSSGLGPLSSLMADGVVGVVVSVSPSAMMNLDFFVGTGVATTAGPRVGDMDELDDDDEAGGVVERSDWPRTTGVSLNVMCRLLDGGGADVVMGTGDDVAGSALVLSSSKSHCALFSTDIRFSGIRLCGRWSNGGTCNKIALHKYSFLRACLKNGCCSNLLADGLLK